MLGFSGFQANNAVPLSIPLDSKVAKTHQVVLYTYFITFDNEIPTDGRKFSISLNKKDFIFVNLKTLKITIEIKVILLISPTL